MSTTPQRIHLRAGTQAQWTAANPVLEANEPGYETDTKRIKVGDGVTAWSALPYGHLNSDPRTLNSLGFTLDAGLTADQGQLTWNADEQTLDLGKGDGITLQVGQEQLSLCRNSTASTIPIGTTVMFAGTLGNSGRLLVAPMVADGTYPGYVFFGITTKAIAAGADGFVTTFGKIRGIDTRTYSEGAILWCNPAVPGGLTATEPQAPNLKLPVAAVISSANNGTIFVRWDAGRRLQDLHDVQANGGTQDGDVLTWIAANDRWEAAPPPTTESGLPTGGDPGNVLIKQTGANYDADWAATVDGGSFN